MAGGGGGGGELRSNLTKSMLLDAKLEEEGDDLANWANTCTLKDKRWHDKGLI